MLQINEPKRSTDGKYDRRGSGVCLALFGYDVLLKNNILFIFMATYSYAEQSNLVSCRQIACRSTLVLSVPGTACRRYSSSGQWLRDENIYLFALVTHHTMYLKAGMAWQENWRIVTLIIRRLLKTSAQKSRGEGGGSLVDWVEGSGREANFVEEVTAHFA